MKRYKTRPGIVFTKICGVKLLIPTRKASEDCPRFKRLNFFTSMIWQMLEAEKTMEEIYELLHIFIKEPDEIVREKVDKILIEFEKDGFLIAEEDSKQ